MKSTEQHFIVELFIMLYKVVVTFGSVDEIKNVTIQVKATEQCFPVCFCMFVMLVELIFTLCNQITTDLDSQVCSSTVNCLRSNL